MQQQGALKTNLALERITTSKQEDVPLGHVLNRHLISILWSNS